MRTVALESRNPWRSVRGSESRCTANRGRTVERKSPGACETESRRPAKLSLVMRAWGDRPEVKRPRSGLPNQSGMSGCECRPDRAQPSIDGGPDAKSYGTQEKGKGG